MYFNPCYAGCLNKEGGNYSNCACISTNPTDGHFAVKEHCDTHCPYFWAFMVTGFLFVGFTFMSAMPNVVATLRAVEPVHRSLALGIESIFLRLLGTIPGPVIFGYLIDNTCLLWQEQECADVDEKRGNCRLYDNGGMAIAMLVTIVIVKLLGILFFGTALFFSGRSHIPDKLEDDDDDEGEEDNV